MQIIKKFFGRLFIVGAAILLQIVLVAALFTWFNSFFAASQIIMEAIAIIVIISVINRDMMPEAKIPWIIFIMLIPLFGTVVYILLGENHLSKKERCTLTNIGKANGRFLSVNEDVTEKIEKSSLKYKNQISYLKKAAGQVPYEKTETKFYPSGEEYYKDLLTELKSAREFIFLEYFILKEGEMLGSIVDILKEKVKAGVEVRLMYDDLGSIGDIPDKYDMILSESGIKCVKFAPFKPAISERHNNRDHRKIAVIDGKTAFTGGINFADEYINLTHPHGYWKDTGIRVRGDAVEGFTLMFLSAFCMQTGSIEDFGKYIKPRRSEYASDGFVIPYGDGPRPQYNEYIAENILLNMLGGAEKYVYITTPYLIIDNKLSEAICNAARCGVDVRIVTPHIPDKKIVFTITRSNYEKLLSSGVSIYEYTPGFIHAKEFVCDGEYAQVGTVNLDYRSLVHHYECGCLLYKTKTVKDIEKDFEKLFVESENMKNYKQHGFSALISRIAAAFAPLL